MVHSYYKAKLIFLIPCLVMNSGIRCTANKINYYDTMMNIIVHVLINDYARVQLACCQLATRFPG